MGKKGAAATGPSATVVPIADQYVEEEVDVDQIQQDDEEKFPDRANEECEPLTFEGGQGFIQIGEFRIGNVDGTHFSISHKNGNTQFIARRDGNWWYGPRQDYGLWK